VVEVPELVEVVAVVLVLVGELVLELVLVLVLVGLVDVVVVLELLVVLDVVLVLVLGLVLVDIELDWHCCVASCLIVLAPWLRSRCSVELIVDGRFATPLVSALAALDAAPHCPEATAEEIESSCAFNVLDWSDESRPEPPPQAARKAVARPRPPARSARGAWRIRGVTLEALAVAVRLGAHWPYARRSAKESGSLAARIAAAAPEMSYSVRR
jgi:hypothetical protein